MNQARAQQEADAQAQTQAQPQQRGGRSGAPARPTSPPSQPVQPPLPSRPPYTASSVTTSPSGNKSNMKRKESDKGVNWAGFYASGKPKNKKIPKNKTTLDNVPMAIKAEGPLTDKEQIETEMIKTLMESYFNIVRKNTQDIIPKSIMHFLVNKSKDALHNRLVERLYKEELFEELLGESPEIIARRNTTREMVQMLKRATEILNEVRDFALK